MAALMGRRRVTPPGNRGTEYLRWMCASGSGTDGRCPCRLLAGGPGLSVQAQDVPPQDAGGRRRRYCKTRGGRGWERGPFALSPRLCCGRLSGDSLAGPRSFSRDRASPERMATPPRGVPEPRRSSRYSLSRLGFIVITSVFSSWLPHSVGGSSHHPQLSSLP